MKTVSTKKTLLASVFAMLLCVSMFVGSTFAWFTSTATTSVNTIQAGNLKVELLAADGESPLGDSLKWVKAAGAEDEDVLWEPGCSYNLEGFRIKNAGNLALKYKVVINGLTGSAKLLEVIDFTVKMGEEEYTLEGWEGKLGADDITDVITITGTMKADAGNDYMNEEIKNISITVVATQDTVESDSNNNEYDKFAEYEDVTIAQIAAGDETTVNNAVKEAIAAAKKVDTTTGKTTPTQIVLPANTTVTLESGVATPAQGQISDIKITGDKTAKIEFQNSTGGSDGSGTTYQDRANLTFQGVTISGGTEQFVARGGVVTFIDCTINGEIKKTTADKFVFSGCSFTAPVSQANYGCKDIVFDGCKFDTVDGYGIKIYSEGYEKTKTNNLTVKNCEFKNTANAAKAAIFLDHIIDGLTYNVTVENCTFDGFTAEPTANNKWGNREIIASSFIKSGEQYVFAYQTGNVEPYHHILDASQLVVTVK